MEDAAHAREARATGRSITNGPRLGWSRARRFRARGRRPRGRRARRRVVAAAVAQAHGAGLRLAGAADEHVGYLAQLRLADAVAELLVAVVELAAHARGPQPLVHRA